ncbi:MAG: diaminopimelate decarboxylase [Oscillospiraceae bacterium]|nr:diaminopimelate decarboxylase [Oscillospiraceae bacterium]
MKDTTLFIDKATAERIASEFPTPFIVYDERGIKRRAKDLNAAFSWNEGFREYFAVKATPTPAILKILLDTDCGLDCATLAELIIAERVGAVGELSMFSSNCTPDEDFIKAKELGAVINFDDFTHIDVVEQLCGIPQTVCCRFNPGGNFGVDDPSGNVMDIPGDAKYGMTERQLIDAFVKLKSLGATRFGLHAFLASNTQSDAYYPALAGLMFDVALLLERETGVRVSFINLSGGIGVPHRPEENERDIFAIGEGVRREYDKRFADWEQKPAILTELGRYVLAPNGALITRAIREKHIYKEYIGVDASAADFIRPAMYGSYHHVTVLGKENDPHDKTYDITGGLCENSDKFAVDRPLPTIENGDLLALHDCGAHGKAMGYNYNGKLRCGEVLLKENGSFEVIRRKETLADYFATIEKYF